MPYRPSGNRSMHSPAPRTPAPETSRVTASRAMPTHAARRRVTASLLDDRHQTTLRFHLWRESRGDSLDHLIRPLQERRRDRQAEGLGRLEVDEELERPDSYSPVMFGDVQGSALLPRRS